MVEADVDVSKGQARPRPASRLLLPLHSWLPQWSSKRLKHFPFYQAPVVAFEALLSIKLPPPVSRTGVDLEVVFLAGLQNTLLEAHTRSLGSLKTRAAMMRRCMIDEKLGCSHDADVGIDDDLMSR